MNLSFAGCWRRKCIVCLLLVWWQAGCAGLPDVPQLQENRSPARQPGIVTVSGELPQARKQVLLDDMAARVGPTDILARHVAAEEEISGRPLMAGNKVTLLDDGPMTMRAMMDAIRSARDHINLETYIIEDDEVGRALAGLLIEKQRAGVMVNLIYDSVGALGTPREYFEHLRAAGVNVLEYHPINPHAATGTSTSATIARSWWWTVASLSPAA
jgi:cardiolipin synthase A/B